MHLLIATTILLAITSLLEAFSCVMRNNPLLFSPETGNLVNFSGYVLNTTLIYLVVLYILSLTGVNKTLSVWQKVVCALPYLFLTTIFLLPWTRHWIFYMTPDGQFHHGPLVWFADNYLYIYMAFSFLVVLFHRKHFSLLSWIFLLLMCFIYGTCNLLDIYYPYLKISNFLWALILIIASLQLDHDSAEKTIRQWQLTSWTDNLSGLKNRDGLDADTAQLIHHPLFVAMLDIDFFKEFNDEAGHAAGDLVIKQAASHMKHVFGNSAYRIGGDEFLVIFKGNLTIFNAKLTQLEQLTQSISIENITRKVNFSIGQCYGTPRTTEALYKMIRLADISLYDAKQSGRGRMGKLMVLKT
ncbi:GGDEF domain-containing protein [Dialister histaminiformans]|nr:GGDEF domain-containing protein [Allisonella histaminiformans]